MSAPSTIDGPTSEDLAQALHRWQRAAGPYWMYVCAEPFLRSLPMPTDKPPPEDRGALDIISTLREDQQLAVFVDLPPTRVLPLTPELNDLGFHLIPIVQRWPAAPAVLRCERLAEQLVETSSHLRAPRKPHGVVFLLDGDRTGLKPGAVPRVPDVRPMRVFDNRYEYPMCRFPPTQLLLSEGVQAVHWISPAGLAPDVLLYVERLQTAGLAPSVHSSRRT